MLKYSETLQEFKDKVIAAAPDCFRKVGVEMTAESKENFILELDMSNLQAELLALQNFACSCFWL